MLGVFFGKKTVVNRLDFASFIFFYVTAFADPFCSQWWKTLGDVAVKIGIAPRTARIVNPHWFVYFDLGR